MQKEIHFFFVAACLACLAVTTTCFAEVSSLPPAAHDKGGLSFDFAECSERRFASLFDSARNVVKEKVAGVLHGGKKSVEWNRIDNVPVEGGKTYRVSLRTRKGDFAGSGVGQATLFHLRPGTRTADGKFKTLDNYRSDKATPVNASGSDWAAVTCLVTPPAGSTTLVIQIRRARKDDSTIEYKDLTVAEAERGEPFEIKLMPMENLDGRFFIGEGQVGELECCWRTTDGRKLDPRFFRFSLTLPAGVEYIDSTFAEPETVVVSKSTGGSTKVVFAPRGVTFTGRFNPTSRAPSILLKATGRQGPCGRFGLTLEYRPKKGDGFTVESEDLELVIAPAVKAAAKPQRYANGAMFMGAFRMPGREGVEALSRTMTDAGVTWMAGNDTPETYALWRRLGVKKITPVARNFVNGFYISSREWVPPSDRWVTHTNLPVHGHADYVARATCPVSVYTESDFFRTNTVPYIRDFVKDADGCWSNWEPYMFRRRGCFCDKCCRAFAAWIGKPYDEISAAWPENVMAGGEYFDIVQKFRSQEHGKVVKTIDKVVREATGGDESVGFIPAICWIEMGSWWRPRNYAAEVQAIDYAGSLKWMNPWGPYAQWSSNTPYVYSKRGPLCHFFAAKDVRKTVDGDYPPRGRPKLMALPQGRQCFSWVTQPEHISMALDSFFFWGWESTVVYFFPHGYDSRYWAAFADATARAAKYESFVLDGRRLEDAAELEPVKELYASPVRYLSGYLPRCTDVSPLQALSYEKDGVRVTAVFNFWQKGEAFFKLKEKGLDPAASYTLVSECGVLRAKNGNRRVWTGAELAEGVMLSVGAARTRVFEIRPAAMKTGAKSILTDAALEEAMKSRALELRKEAEKDAEAERGSRERKGTSSDQDLQVI